MPDPVSGVNATDALGINPTDQSSGGPAASGAVQSAAAAAVDTADVTKVETLLAQIGSMADAIPTVDQARVSAIQQSIANGTYQVDPQALAQKMVDLERLLTATPAPGQ